MRLEAGRPGRLRVQGELFLDHRRGLTEELGGQRQGLSESLQGSTDLTLGGPPSRPHHLQRAHLQTPSPEVWFQQVNLGDTGLQPTACRAVCTAADVQSCPVGRGKQSCAVV